MLSRTLGRTARLSLLLGAAIGLAAPPMASLAQTAPAAAAAKPKNPRDLTGIWMNDNTLDETLKREGRVRQQVSEVAGPARVAGPSPLTPEYQEIQKQLDAEAAKLADGAQACDWPGMPGIMTYPFPFEILHNAGRITFLFEGHSQVRRIWMDRDKHIDPDELDPSYNGDSIGRWEGDVLVIDTVGINTRTKVRGLPHSDQMRIVERIRWLDEDTVEDEMTLTDPKAFARPIVSKVVYSRRPDWRIGEYNCLENNRDAPDASGQRRGGVVQ